jgi:hypothetical protein
MLVGLAVPIGRADDARIVLIVTIAITAEVPLNEIEFGETMHVDCAGAPLQLSATVWLKPPAGETATV